MNKVSMAIRNFAAKGLEKKYDRLAVKYAKIQEDMSRKQRLIETSKEYYRVTKTEPHELVQRMIISAKNDYDKLNCELASVTIEVLKTTMMISALTGRTFEEIIK